MNCRTEGKNSTEKRIKHNTEKNQVISFIRGESNHARRHLKLVLKKYSNEYSEDKQHIILSHAISVSSRDHCELTRSLWAHAIPTYTSSTAQPFSAVFRAALVCLDSTKERNVQCSEENFHLQGELTLVKEIYLTNMLAECNNYQ